MKPLKSVYAKELKRFVAFRKKLGLSFDPQSEIIEKFDAYVAERGHQGLLTQELALSFAGQSGGVSKKTAACRYQVVHHFSDFLSVTVPQTPRLDPKALKSPKDRPAARILTDEELARILSAAHSISRRSPMRGITLHMAIGLTACTGLRIREVCRLDLSDLDTVSGTLLIRKTKFSKDRIVPLHESTLIKMNQYVVRRNEAYTTSECPAIFLQRWGQRFARHTLQCSFQEARIKAGFSEDNAPTFHSLRHTFAVNRLVAWYREGKDVQAMLPLLATYMGHVHYTHTAWYLSAVPELLELAAERYWDFIGENGGS